MSLKYKARVSFGTVLMEAIFGNFKIAKDWCEHVLSKESTFPANAKIEREQEDGSVILVAVYKDPFDWILEPKEEEMAEFMHVFQQVHYEGKEIYLYLKSYQKSDALQKFEIGRASCRERV